MGTNTLLSRRAFGLLWGLGLLSLVFLGSPGCGCGSDNLTPPLDERPPRCCCDFEWLPPSNVFDATVVITLENQDASLDGVVTPSVLTGVNGRTFEQFTVCINEEHLLGDQMEIVFTDQNTLVVYARALLIYQKRCTPLIEPLSGEVNLVSTDCGEDTLFCCCDFEWLPGPNQAGDLVVLAESVSAGLVPTIFPSTLNGVVGGEIENFEVCVNADHAIGASFNLVVRTQGTNALVGMVTLQYDEPCIPTVIPAATVPTLELTSTECGGDPLPCCCTFEWLPGPNMDGDVTLTAQNVSAGLTVNITPSLLTNIDSQTLETFDVCVNADHALLASFDLVVTSTPGAVVLGMARVTYRIQCEPDIADVPGTPSLQLTSTECGGPPLVCCCDFTWTAPTAWNPPGGPWTATLESVDGTLAPATITPDTVDTAAGVPAFVIFTVCVNPLHSPTATLDIVLRGATGVEFARLPLLYDLQCLPIMGDPSGEGFWNSSCQPD